MSNVFFVLGVFMCFIIRPTTGVQFFCIAAGYVIGGVSYQLVRGYLDKRASQHKGE